MKKGFSGQPESFSISPLLSLLPVQGKVTRLEALTSSLFARYEKVRNQLRDESETATQKDIERYTAEETMLRQVLEWLDVTPREELADLEEEVE